MKKTEKPDHRIELIPLSEIQKWPGNPKLHADLAPSFDRFGFVMPPMRDDKSGRLVAGHGRIEQLTSLRAAGKPPPARVKVRANDGEWLVPVITGVAFTDEKEAAAYVIGDNQLTEAGGWDLEKKDAILREIAQTAASYGGIGLTEEDLQRLAAGAAGTGGGDGAGGGGHQGGPVRRPENEQKVAKIQLPKIARTKKGEILELGRHRLMCGDCREPADMAMLMGDEKANVVVTSPPYAAQREYDKTSEFKPIPPDDYGKWFEAVQKAVKSALAPDGSFFLNIKEHCDEGERVLYVLDLVIAMKRKWGWRRVEDFCWKHGGFPGYWKDRFKNQWEPVFQFTRKGDFKFRPKNVMRASDAAFERVGPRDLAATGNTASFDVSTMNVHEGMALPGNVLEVGKSKESIEHTALFPKGLPDFFIRAYSDEDDLVLDPFGGAGTTLIAAEMAGRRCVLMEISPRYCDVIAERWRLFQEEQANPSAAA